MRRIALATAAALTLIAGLTAAPAHATVQVQQCWKYDDGVELTANICIAANYRRDADGVGVTVDSVRIWASGSVSQAFESKIEDCDNVRLWNNSSVVYWRKDNAQCDLTKANPSVTWYPGNHFPNSDGHIGWTFYPKINGGADPGYTHLHLDLLD